MEHPRLKDFTEGYDDDLLALQEQFQREAALSKPAAKVLRSSSSRSPPIIKPATSEPPPSEAPKRNVTFEPTQNSEPKIERFRFNPVDQPVPVPVIPSAPGGGFSLIKEIVERPTSKDVRAPDASQSPSGFPEPSKKKTSLWKHRQEAKAKAAAVVGETATPPAASATKENQSGIGAVGPTTLGGLGPRVGTQLGADALIREEMDAENRLKLAEMSTDEIMAEQKELMERFGQGLLEKLKNRKKARIVETGGDVPGLEVKLPEEEERAAKPVTFDEVAFPGDIAAADPALNPPPPQLSSESDLPESIKAHFPQPPPSTTAPIPESALLDPNDPNFTEELHAKYFPNLPHDPTKLSWTLPASKEEDEGQYHPSQDSVLPAEMRFDFNGNLLSPRQSREIPVNIGLHHHGDAPTAAGYTVPELAHLARSTFPSQKAFAIQTLGRILWKIGSGVYGDEIGGMVWEIAEIAKATEIIDAEAAKEGGHLTVKAVAVEAAWMWTNSGGRERYGRNLSR
ncbi:hypothetical protein SAICODRAFT_24689 [Saitoella complicata NRRL Y-17804]|uniref:RNA polymerase II-associated protein 1 C-terminal domain-containing protein n=1 Tax=Saitoella complicata (strain BCRC 22490 / CBS 7301 / JCM 7358 / NBRC 10748 / NRRL Y-17804) TaxID=698492 RepID=A0A0E9NAM5_SAICN|nr:uncharacterized protein SAICODRAFT_24689 [Saitoella complicata NRRL Y-17804]ODQ53917.1 hypothetical protein SAICODRAFT_24689 [Saitoella complicata NRRL Y-17804]GAO46869.1 hypothetical protein G7K_1087-t1 [Saitoella complicata NRRL Y-17804]